MRMVNEFVKDIVDKAFKENSAHNNQEMAQYTIDIHSL